MRTYCSKLLVQQCTDFETVDKLRRVFAPRFLRCPAIIGDLEHASQQWFSRVGDIFNYMYIQGQTDRFCQRDLLVRQRQPERRQQLLGSGHHSRSRCAQRATSATAYSGVRNWKHQSGKRRSEASIVTTLRWKEKGVQHDEKGSSAPTPSAVFSPWLVIRSSTGSTHSSWPWRHI